MRLVARVLRHAGRVHRQTQDRPRPTLDRRRHHKVPGRGAAVDEPHQERPHETHDLAQSSGHSDHRGPRRSMHGTRGYRAHHHQKRHEHEQRERARRERVQHQGDARGGDCRDRRRVRSSKDDSGKFDFNSRTGN